MKLKSLSKIDAGGFGNVDLVEDSKGQQFARKTFSVNQPLSDELKENVRKRFIREARIQEGMSHKNIVPVVGGDLDADPPYYLMPVAKSTLAKDLEKSKTLDGRYLSAISDIVAGLEELHEVDIFHRDLNPRNVLRFGDGKDAFYAIGDFGLISQRDSTISQLTSTGMMKGSDYFTAPEITADLKRASAQSDIYSLGCILHEMVGDEDRVPCMEIREDGEFGAILLNCTRTTAKRRFKSVRAVLDAIVSTDPTAPAAEEKDIGRFLKGLEKDGGRAAKFWSDLVEFLEDHPGSNEARAILMKLSLSRIQEVCDGFSDSASRLGSVLAQWITSSAFNFDSCDGLANRLEVFIRSCPLAVSSECLLALLEMGTSHNRFYVERKFMGLCDPSMEDKAAKRLAIEFRAVGDDICSSIRHIERSIGTKRDALHPVLVTVLAEMCP